MTATTTPAGTHDPAEKQESAGAHHTANPALTGVLAAAQAIVTGLLMVIVPAVAFWILTPKISVAWSEAVRVAANIYVLGQGGSVALAHGQVDVVPLGLAAPLTWVAWLGGCRVRDAAADLTGVPLRRFLLVGGAAFVLLHTLAVTIVAAVAGNTAARAPLGAAWTGSLTIAGLGLAIALYPLWRPVDGRWADVLGAAARTLVGWLGLGLLLVIIGLLFGFSKVADVQNALHPGAAGHALLIFLQLILLPTAILWASAFGSGAGFALGSGTWISPSHTELGPMPAVPLLGAVPEPGRHSVAMVILPLLVVLIAAYAGYRLQAQRGAQLIVARIVDAFLVALLVTGVAYGLADLSSGAVGPGRMADIGPSPLGLALVLFAEVFCGLLIGTFVGPLIASGRAGNAAQRGARKAGRATASGLGAAADKARDLSGTAAERARELGENAARNAREIGAPAVGKAKDKAREKASETTRNLRRGRGGSRPGEGSSRPNSRPRR